MLNINQVYVKRLSHFFQRLFQDKDDLLPYLILTFAF